MTIVRIEPSQSIPCHQAPPTAIDIFAGIGGWNLALSALGIPVVMAANHSARSLETLGLNFPHTRCVNVDIMTCDTGFIPDVDIMTASPECTNQSHSRGVPLKHQRQLRLWTDRSEDPFVTLSRETMNGVCRWAAAKARQEKPIKLICVENVTDLRLWGGLEDWYARMEMLGYQHKTISLNSMFARPIPVPVPQSRDRAYIVLWLKDLPAPNLAIGPRGTCRRCQREVAAVQCWRGQEARFGDYGEQYDYLCPTCDTRVTPFYTPVEYYLDWSLPAPRIGDRAKPLCANTLQKIRKGLTWYVKQQEQGHQVFLMSYYGKAVYRSVHDVAGTVTTRDRHCLITLPENWSGKEIPDVGECGYRMCTLSEYQHMMGIPPQFRFRCGKTHALEQLGLAVTPAAAVEVLIRSLRSLGYERDENERCHEDASGKSHHQFHH